MKNPSPSAGERDRLAARALRRDLLTKVAARLGRALESDETDAVRVRRVVERRRKIIEDGIDAAHALKGE